MNLDQLARDAADELRARSVPEASARFEDLRRTRTHRSVVRGVAVVVVGVLVIGVGVTLSGIRHRVAEPSHPVGASNGALVATNGTNVVVLGGRLDHLPAHMARYSNLTFIGDGSELVYSSKTGGGLVAMNVTSGQVRRLASCRSSECAFTEVSPDGSRVAEVREVAGKSGIELRTVGSAASTFLPLPQRHLGWLRWSPDGTALAVSGRDGLYLVSVDGGEETLLHRYRDQSALPATWSPDGDSIAFLDPRPVTSNEQVSAWTLMTVRRDGSDLRRLRDVGACYCIGISPPAVAWSPDGGQIAVTAIDSGRQGGSARSGGLFSIHPDGTGWTSLGASSAGLGLSLAWQPVPTD